jgi:hypothetical protein
MFRIWKAPLIAVFALASLFVSAPAASARVAGPRVVIRGGFYGPGWGWYGPAWYGVAKAKNLPLPRGNHDVELRGPSGNTLYRESVQVIPGRTTEIHPDLAG